MTTAITYCQRWNDKLGKPIEPITEAEARHRFSTDGPHWFTAVIGEAPEPDCAIELAAHATVVKSFFYYPDRSIRYIYEFDKHDDQRLFLSTVIRYEYPDKPGWHGQNEATLVEEIAYTPEGVCRITLDDTSKPTIEITDYRDVDVTPNWEAVPAFGDWASLARRDRG